MAWGWKAFQFAAQLTLRILSRVKLQIFTRFFGSPSRSSSSDFLCSIEIFHKTQTATVGSVTTCYGERVVSFKANHQRTKKVSPFIDTIFTCNFYTGSSVWCKGFFFEKIKGNFLTVFFFFLVKWDPSKPRNTPLYPFSAHKSHSGQTQPYTLQ